MKTKVKKERNKKRVSNKTLTLIRQMLECIPPARLKKNLLNIFLIYLEREHQHLPINFDSILSDHYLLFRFLDEIDDEMKIMEEKNEKNGSKRLHKEIKMSRGV